MGLLEKDELTVIRPIYNKFFLTPCTKMAQTDINDAILSRLSSIDQKLISSAELSAMVESMKEMKKDISELKYTLLNPENGVIVKTNRNTDITSDQEDRISDLEDAYIRIDELISFKNTVTKALWILFTALVGIVVKLVTMS